MVEVRKRNVDLIYLTDCASAIFGYMVNRLTGTPYLVTGNGRDVTFGNPVYQLLLRMALRKAARVVAVSQALREECIRRGASPNDCVVIPNGIDPNQFATVPPAPPPWPPVLLSVGRLVEKKGFHVFVGSILPAIIEIIPELEYWVVGDGPLRRRIVSESQKAGIHRKVKLFGEVPMDSPSLLEFYQKASLVVMPNIEVKGDFEGFGIVALESAACGKLVLAYAQDGVIDAVAEGRTGFLIPPGNSKLFISRIVSLLQEREKLAELGGAAREYVLRHFDWSRVAKRYVAEFESVFTEIRAAKRLGDSGRG